MSTSDQNMDHADLLEASGKFDHEDYKKWLDRQDDEVRQDQWWQDYQERNKQ